MAASLNRPVRHLLLGAGSVIASIALASVLHQHDGRDRISTATAYVALGLLAITLCIGPVNVLRGRPNPVSFNLRRDFGIWSAIAGVLHAAIGLTVHLRGRMQLYFLAEAGHAGVAGLRTDAFGAANDTGLAAALLLIVLGAISNDVALRRLGVPRWRAIQRMAYLVIALTTAHAVIYQAIEKQRLPLVLILAALTMTVVTLQMLGRMHHLTRERAR